MKRLVRLIAPLLVALCLALPAAGETAPRLGTVLREIPDQVGVFLVQTEPGAEPQKGDVVAVLRGEEKLGEATAVEVGSGRFRISLKGDYDVRAGDSVCFVRSPAALVPQAPPPSRPTGSAATSAPPATGGARLEVSGTRISTTGVGRVVVVEATVRNEGNAPAEGVSVRCRLVTDAKYVRYTDTVKVGRLEPGQSRPVRFDTGMSSPRDLNATGTRFELEDTSPNRPAGRPVIGYQVELTAGGGATAASSSPAPAAAPAQGADLVVDSIAVSSTGDTPFTAKMVVVIRVSNVGTVAVRQAVPVAITIDGSSHGSETLWNGLQPGTSATVSVSLSEAYRQGNHTLQATVDPANAIPESNEANNKASRNL